MTHVVGIALSEHAVTAQMHDARSGRRVREHTVPVAAPVDGVEGESDIDAVGSAVQECFDAVDGASSGAVALSSPLHGLVLLDGSGRAVRAALSALDRRSAPDAGWCRKKLEPEWWAQHVGVVPTANHPVTKFSWVHRSEPELWARAQRFVTPHDHLAALLVGEERRPLTDRAAASGTGYWSPDTAGYVPEVLSLIDAERSWSGALPDVVAAGTRLGVRGSTAVAVGTSRIAALSAAVGMGPGDVMIVLEEPVRIVALAAHGGTLSPVVDDNGLWVERLVDAQARAVASVALEGRAGDVVTPDVLRSVLEQFARSGASTDGAITVVGDRSDVSVVAPWLAKALGRRVSRCGAQDAAAMGAARCAAVALNGAWPEWQVPTSQR